MAVDVQVSSSGHLPDEPEVTADPVTGEAIRAIAPIVGVDRKTIERDIRGGTNVPPASGLPSSAWITPRCIETLDVLQMQHLIRTLI